MTLAATREKALLALASVEARPTASVEYHSRGRLLFVADADGDGATAAFAAARERTTTAHILLVADSRAAKIETRDGVTAVVAAPRSLRGHLGAFAVEVEDQGGGRDLAQIVGASGFDVIVDLRATPLFSVLPPSREIPPPGYFCARGETAAAEIEKAAQTQGTYRKPLYFAYDSAVCAHGANKIKACSRCLESCGAAAISSRGDKIEVDSNLCQGCAACAVACPSGAIRFAYPPPGDTLEGLRRALAVFAESKADAAPVVFFYPVDRADVWRERKHDAPPRALPTAVEEIGSVGLEAWLFALAHGAAGIVVAFSAAVETRLQKAIEEQMEIARAILRALGFPPEAAQTMRREQNAADFFWPQKRLCAPAQFAGGDDKRAVFFRALDHLAAAAGADGGAAMPAAAPFGAVAADAQKCTLCMACVGACPVSALRAGGDSPRLSFVEENCVQCGLCVATCPEDALSLSPRLLFAREERKTARVICEDSPFLCVVCAQPFATHAGLQKVAKALSNHPLFAGDARARRRLQMCGDCRAKDILVAQ